MFQVLRWWPALAVWGVGWAAMLWLDGRVDLANLAMVLILSAALASLWLHAWVAVAAGAAAVMAFNWLFVPPRGTFTVDIRQHALLLMAMLVVNGIVAVLVGRLRGESERARLHAVRAEQLRNWGETLRDAQDPLAHTASLAEIMKAVCAAPIAVMALKDHLPAAGTDPSAVIRVGGIDADQWAGLWHCLRLGQALGAGTGRHEDQHDWYLPMRGRSASLGAVLVADPRGHRVDLAVRPHLQALSDQMGLALERTLAARDDQIAREEAQAQSVRNAMLAAISHDYRTPLATIIGAASSLEAQGDRMDGAQRARLAHSVVDEATRLSRLTDNTLQLARLDTPGVTLGCDWESAEELVGTALRRARLHDPERRVRARLEPGLPLLWCDAILMSQLLDNLIDNALKYSPSSSAVELLVHRREEGVVLAVRDRGPGILPSRRERVFEVFQRGGETDGPVPSPADRARARSGAGVGLAVCRAIARAHGGDLKLRARGHGGSAFECWLPLRDAPDAAAGRPGDEAAA